MSRVGMSICFRWGHIFDLSLLLHDLKLDCRLHNLHMVHWLRSRVMMVLLMAVRRGLIVRLSL